jgi:hypothetical protein
MLSGHFRTTSGGESMQEDKVPREDNEEDEEEREQVHNQKEAALTKNMNIAMAKLNLSLLDGEWEQDENEEFANTIDGEDGINLLSDDEDFLKEDLSKYYEDPTLFGNDYDTSLEVSSGVFNTVHSNKFEVPDNFKQLIWNEAGPSPGSMIILLGLLKDELEADQAGPPTEFNRWPMKLLDILVHEAGENRNDQINYIKQITAELRQLGQTNSRKKALSLDKGIGQSNASKTQRMLPGAHEASPTEEAVIELAIMAGWDKEGAQSLSMAAPG